MLRSPGDESANPVIIVSLWDGFAPRIDAEPHTDLFIGTHKDRRAA